jgi:hypothetical protein
VTVSRVTVGVSVGVPGPGTMGRVPVRLRRRTRTVSGSRCPTGGPTRSLTVRVTRDCDLGPRAAHCDWHGPGTGTQALARRVCQSRPGPVGVPVAPGVALPRAVQAGPRTEPEALCQLQWAGCAIGSRNRQ